MNLPEEKSTQPSDWKSDLFRDPAMTPGGMRIDRGLIGHVPIVAILMIVQGVLELFFCVFGFGFFALTFVPGSKEFQSMRGLGILFVVVCVPTLISGLLRIVAGVFNFRYRRRGLGMTSLLLGLATMMTGYCAPTAIGLCVYGLIVYVNEPVVLAFQMGDAGKPLGEVRSTYLARP